MKNIVCFWLVAVLFSFAACEDEHDENEREISKNFSDESHKAGQNCMSCHISGGGGEGWFTVAGSVYNKALTDTEPNGVVKITTEPNGGGAVLYQIEVDEKGNFYTTETVDFGEGLFVKVESHDGSIKYMNSKVTNGACNSCHGSDTDKIWVE